MTPLSGQPAVVEVEPSDHSTNVESTVDRVELVVSSGHFGAIGYYGALNNGTEDVPALLELERLETAAERVDEDPAGSVELQRYRISLTSCHVFQCRTASSESILTLWT